jgi:predicted nucleotidyltransferase
MKERSYAITAEQREQIARRITEAFRLHPGVAFAYLYGSVLDGERVHDLDIGLYLEKDDVGRTYSLVDQLTSQLTADLHVPVDIRVLNGAPVTFLYHVFRGDLLFSRNDELLTSMLEEVARRYLDLAPLLRQATKDAFAA